MSMDISSSLEGQLVEIHGYTSELGDDAFLRDPGSKTSFVPNGKTGCAMALDQSSGKYAVETFDGLLLAIAPEHLKVWVPLAPEAGGFDVTWPAHESEVLAFAPLVVQTLRQKDYCVIQMYTSESQRRQAMAESELLKFTRMKSELEAAYLGRSKESKVHWLAGPAGTEEESVLQGCDQYFGSLCQMVSPLTDAALGFTSECRTHSMVRMHAGSLKSHALTEDDIDDGLVESHISFCRRRQLCMLMVVGSAGADLKLIPQNEEKPTVTLNLTKGQMIIFRHSCVSYEYHPLSVDDLVLQCWLLAPPPPVALQAVHADIEAKDASTGLFSGPSTIPDGNRICVMSQTPGLPSNAHDDKDRYWSLMASGCDGYIKAPIERFDIDVYYKPNDEWSLGYTYACHGGFVFEDIYSFDNKFFNIADEDAWITNPGVRKILEHGFQSLHGAGYTKKSLRGAPLGLFVGHSGDDYNSGVFTFGSEDRHRRSIMNCRFGSYFNQIPFLLGMIGNVQTIDTACSSALVAYNMAHAEMRECETGQTASGCNSGLDAALLMGCNLIPAAGGFVGLSGPHMLSPTGRCYTFDHSADGFARGEGTGGWVVKAQTSVPDEAIAVIIGACTNQDGRSASLTAPNGPAQSACIKASMKEAGKSPNEITCAECHGTGTALGDPIEVGALRGIMGDRILPLMETSAKAHIGHLEASAGMAGVLKCISMNEACCGSPSPHLGELNPNLDVNGYPTIFCTELVPFGGNSGNCGVSSFGWGGANARADVWAPCSRGTTKLDKTNFNTKYVDYMEAVCPIDDGPMYHVDGQAIPSEQSPQFQIGRHLASCIRDEFDAYDYSSGCYEGEYQLAPADVHEESAAPPAGPICIVGTWTAFTEMQEMVPDDDNDDIHSFVVALGDTRCERFHMVVNRNTFDQPKIFPVVDKGTIKTRVMGPENGGEDKNWLIDGRDEEIPAGTMYKIYLKWGANLKVWWERLADTGDLVTTEPDKFEHTYQVMGTFTGWTSLDLFSVEGEKGLYQRNIRLAGKEAFQFMRDHDPSQKFYPAEPRALDPSIPVRGPDDMSTNKNFVVDGFHGESVTLKLKVLDGHVTVEIVQKAKTTKFESIEGPGRHSYSIKGSWNHFELIPMTPDPSKPGVYVCTACVQSMEELFTILIDEDAQLQLHPDVSGAPGKVACKGPDEGSDNNMWKIKCLKPGASFEIKLDFTAVNRKDRVTLKWLTDPVDVESMQLFLGDYASQ